MNVNEAHKQAIEALDGCPNYEPIANLIGNILVAQAIEKLADVISESKGSTLIPLVDPKDRRMD